jgi:hypothetical protein
MKSILLALILVGLIAGASAAPQTVIMNKTYVNEPPGTTPFNIWVGAIIVGIILMMFSFLKFQNGEEGLISIMAWIPIGYAAFTSFAVDRITSIGYSADALGTPILIEIHTIGDYGTIAILLIVLLVFAIGNTYRIWASQKWAANAPEASWHDQHGGL